MKKDRSREPSTVSLSAFLSGFRDRYVGDNGEDFKEFWSSGEEVSESSDEEPFDYDDAQQCFPDYRPRKRDPNTPSRRRSRIHKAKEIVQEFIEQVENHRYAEFNWPPVKRINAGAKEKGKTYFPEEILNAVYAPPTLILVTLVLKEVDSKESIGVRATVNFPIAMPTHKPELEECKLIPTPDPVV